MLFNARTMDCEVLGILHNYKEASGQMVNFEKSEMCCEKDVDLGTQRELANNLEIQRELADNLGVRRVECQDKYLGLPTFVGRSKKDIFSFLKSRKGYF